MGYKQTKSFNWFHNSCIITREIVNACLVHENYPEVCKCFCRYMKLLSLELFHSILSKSPLWFSKLFRLPGNIRRVPSSLVETKFRIHFSVSYLWAKNDCQKVCTYINFYICVIFVFIGMTELYLNKLLQYISRDQ